MCEYLVGNKCTADKERDFCPKNKNKFEMSYNICWKIFNPIKKAQITIETKKENTKFIVTISEA